MNRKLNSELQDVHMPPMPRGGEMESHVRTPFLWSIITALVLTLLAVSAVRFFGGNLDPVLTFLLLLSVSWLGTSTPFWWRAIFGIEKRLNVDLNRDGVKGDPWDTHHLHVTVDGYENDLPFNTREMGWNRNSAILFARSVIRVDDLTEGRWGKRSAAFPDGITQFRNIRSMLEEQGYLDRVGPHGNSTWTLSDKGRDTFQDIATLPILES